MSDAAAPRVNGFVAPRFEPVAEAFARNLAERGELGAAFAAYVGGEQLVDLWGGVADRASGQPWERDTVALLFSGTKGLVAVCALLLVERGQLALADPVARHWPEFAQAGKAAITVGDLLAHRARLPGTRAPLTEGDLLDDAGMAALLAAHEPETDPRAARSYHALTFGWLCGELIRRADPAGRSVGAFFAQEIAQPFELDLWIGLPPALEPRVATLAYGPRWGTDPRYGAAQLAADALLRSVWANPPVFPPGRLPWNERAFHAAEIPATNAIGTARAVARLYGALLAGEIVSPATLALGRRELSRFVDALSSEPMAYGAGFQLQTDRCRFGPPPDAFGHTGAGGSVHGAWPAQRVAFSYVMNELRDDAALDPRADALMQALWRALG